MQKQKIGELNGGWAFLMRIALIAQPFVLAWCIWVTNTMHDLKSDVKLINTTHGATRERLDIHERLPIHSEGDMERLKARVVILERLVL